LSWHQGEEGEGEKQKGR